MIFVMAFMAIAGAAWAQMPDIMVENAKGEQVNFQSFGEKKVPLIVTFWSMSCSPCIQELNAIDIVWDEWREQAEFELVAVSVDDARQTTKARAFVSGRGWADNFTMLYDKNKDLMRALNVVREPQVFIFDKDGNIVYSHTSYVAGTEQEYIEKILSLQEAEQPQQEPVEAQPVQEDDKKKSKKNK